MLTVSSHSSAGAPPRAHTGGLIAVAVVVGPCCLFPGDSAHTAAIGAAAQDISDGGDARKLQYLRLTVAFAVNAMDSLEVHECFRVWWSYVRTSYFMFGVALAGAESSDFGQAQSATAASIFLASMAEARNVDCASDAAAFGIGSSPLQSGDRPFAGAPDTRSA
jgi:hypothetical protein